MKTQLKPSLGKVIWHYFGFQLFFSLLFWLPVFYEFQKRAGLSDSEIFAIQSIYYIVFCLLEIPTGFLADRWGYVRCLKLGAITLVVSNCLPIFIPTYTGFLAHFLLIALSRSFISGASSAYIYDFLKLHSLQGQYKEVEGRARAYGLIAKVVGWAAVGFLMKWHATLPYWLTVASAAVSFAFAAALPEITPRTEQMTGKTGQAQPALAQGISQLRHAMALLCQTPFVFVIMLQGIAVFVLGRICQVNLFQPILAEKSFDVTSYGIVMAAMTLFEAAGSAKPGLITKVSGKFMGDLHAVALFTALIALTLAAIPFTGKAGSLALLCLFAFVTGLSFPVQRQLLNDAIVDSGFRATVLSIESIIDRAACAWVALLIAPFLDAGMLNDFLLISAGVTAAFTAALALATKLIFQREKGYNVGG